MGAATLEHIVEPLFTTKEAGKRSTLPLKGSHGGMVRLNFAAVVLPMNPSSAPLGSD
jgi:hypothetical protein